MLPLGGGFAAEPLPVKKLFLLRPVNKPETVLRPITGPRKLHLLKEHTYRFGFLAGVGGKSGHFQQALQLKPDYPDARRNLDLTLAMQQHAVP